MSNDGKKNDMHKIVAQHKSLKKMCGLGKVFIILSREVIVNLIWFNSPLGTCMKKLPDF